MKIYNGVDALIGNTPLIRLEKIERMLGLSSRLIVKLESMNPAGSAKDRVARRIIEDAEERGLISRGSTIIEPTSGNTGIGIAAISAARGYRAVIVMPSNMSEERKLLIRAYGAELVETPAAEGMTGAIRRADEIAAQTPGAIIAGQFINPQNPRAHYLTTGPEIYSDTDGEVDVFVAGVGTGGTITGVGEYLKEKKASVRVVAVEPSDSPVLSGGKAGAHGIAGIGAGFVPEILNRDIIDEIRPTTLEVAREAARLIARCEGILVGISSGAALAAAIEEAKSSPAGRTVVALLPDTGERYLSAGLFE